mmetsp:Transcript_79720/g.156007  ORF Transcript_79720/g.156007 Transcript_79720/m.156007 type:complete len:83 (-) Transcript_79720:274-522(-)
MTPAPRNPTPDTMVAATRDGSLFGSPTNAAETNIADAKLTIAIVLIILRLSLRQTPMMLPQTAAPTSRLQATSSEIGNEGGT